MTPNTFSTSRRSLPTATATLPTASPACSNRGPGNRRSPRKRWRREACGKIPGFRGRRRLRKPRNPRRRTPIASSLRRFSPARTTIWASCGRKPRNLRRLRSTSNRPRLGSLRSLALIATGAWLPIARNSIPKPFRRLNAGSPPHRMTISSASFSA